MTASFTQRDVSGLVIASEGGSIRHYAASLMKVPLVLAVLRRIEACDVSGSDRVSVPREFLSPVDGSPFRIEDDSLDPCLPAGKEFALDTLIERAITVSSNEATNLLLDLVGFDAVNELLADAGAVNSTVQRHVFDDVSRLAGRTNETTTDDATAVLAAVIGNSFSSPASSERLAALLRAQTHRDLIPVGTPSTAVVGNKEGETSQVRHDMAIVWPSDAPAYFLAVCTTGLSADESVSTIRQIAADAYERRHQRGAR
jgi:beta-lactamase class A